MNSDIPNSCNGEGYLMSAARIQKDQNVKACFLLCCVYDESSERLSIIGLTGFVEKIILGFVKIQEA